MTTRGTDPSNAAEGCWAVYGYDVHAEAYSVHASEIDALREAVGGYYRVVFWPWGVRLTDAIKLAEERA